MADSFNDTKTPTLTRRSLLRAGGATAALLGAARIQLPSGALAQSAGPEVKGAKLGYIALTDAAPMIVAKEKGLFDKYGLTEMAIEKQASWAATRDNLVLGTPGATDDDCRRVLEAVNLTGVYNTVPDVVASPTNGATFDRLADAAGVPRLEFRGELRTPTQQVSSAKLRAAGFEFEHPDDEIV